jgi:heavy metal sensor kinase
MNTRSLSFRLVTWYASLLIVVFVLLGALTLLFLRHYLEANLLDAQARRARQIADTLLVAADHGGETGIGQQVEDLYSPEANDRFMRITRGDGRVLYASGAPKDRSFDPLNVPAPQLEAGQGRLHEERLPQETPRTGSLLIAAVPYTSPAGSRYLVEVGASTIPTDETVAHVLIMLAVGLPIAVLFAVVGGFVLVRRSLRPVDRIAHKAEQITQQNLSERLPVVQTGDELERLATSLNHMIARLEDAVTTSKRFVADASHELRTPLSVLRGELESLAQSREMKPQARETLGSMLEEVDRLAEIVEGLLALSRLDAGEATSEWVRFDLAELASTTADQMSLLAEDKNITVVREASTGLIVEGDRSRIKQVIVNLLDNAIKYTPNGGSVRISVTRDGQSAVLDVTDTGIGIPPGALPHVFERFFRVEESRSREQGGAGLGLSIVKSICAAHGAEVEVTSEPGKGSRFRVRQPLA